MISDWEKGLNPTEEYRISLANELAWFSTCDNRFRFEVKRIKPYAGRLSIYDHERNDQEIYVELVEISYDALFGPDFEDVENWSNMGMKWLDEEYLPNL